MWFFPAHFQLLPSTPAANATFKENLASTQTMSFESATSLHAVIDTAYDVICNSIMDETLADVLPCMC